MVKKSSSLKQDYRFNFYPYLLSIFFVLHGYAEHFGFIPIRDVLWLSLKYLVITTLLIFLFRLIYKNFSIAILATFITLCLFFFFGAIHDFLKSIFSKGLLSQYSVVLPFLFLIYFILLAKLKGLVLHNKLIKYFNVLFGLLLLFDAGTLVYKKVNSQNQNLISIKCKHCDKPDVYLIVLDEYAGQTQLINEFGFVNTLFYEELRQSGFYVSPDSRSNYTSTPFSISSFLNMSYHSLKSYETTSESLNYCFKKIYENSVVNSLKNLGYKFYNFSIFDFKDDPSLINKTFLISGSQLITSQTLFSRMEKDLYNNLLMQHLPNTGLYKNFVFKDLDNNKLLVTKTLEAAGQINGQPKFIYLHLMMPHFPYYYNQNGSLNNIADIRYDKIGRKDLYLNYLKYTNAFALKFINEIKAKSEKEPVICLISDHGFRYGNNKNPALPFSNLAAIHLPDGNYKKFEYSFTNVNFFRILFNSYFRQNLAILENKLVD